MVEGVDTGLDLTSTFRLLLGAIDVQFEGGWHFDRLGLFFLFLAFFPFFHFRLGLFFGGGRSSSGSIGGGSQRIFKRLVSHLGQRLLGRGVFDVIHKTKPLRFAISVFVDDDRSDSTVGGKDLLQSLFVPRSRELLHVQIRPIILTSAV